MHLRAAALLERLRGNLFFVPMLYVLGGILLAAVILPETERAERVRFDVAGAVNALPRFSGNHCQISGNSSA